MGAIVPSYHLTSVLDGLYPFSMTQKSPLRVWRETCGYSIRRLETATGINRGRLSMYERGLPVPSEDMERIAAALKGEK